MMLQYNISFDSYYGRILDPVCYKTIGYLDTLLGRNKKLDAGIYSATFDLVNNYVQKLEPSNKGEYTQKLYLSIIFLFQKLKQANRKIENILYPQNFNDYLLLRTYLIPLLDFMSEIHPNSLEVNRFAYEYIVNNQIIENLNHIYIIENENSTGVRISKIESNKFKEYIEKNGLSINISGALLYNHDTKIGTMSKFLDERLKLRKTYQKKRDEYEPGSEDYTFYDRRQLSMKINANSSYGLTGLTSFRYSNKNLARSITLSGKLCLKTAQMFGEIYLKSLNKRG